MIRIFFERLIEWDWPDAPARNPIFHGDIPPRTDPLPKFLNDRDMATLIAAARAHALSALTPLRNYVTVSLEHPPLVRTPALR